MEVTLQEMLDAREGRAFRQQQLNQRYQKPIISFSMNIPGPVKDSPLIRRGFWAGVLALDSCLPKGALLLRQIFPAHTGWEAVYVLDAPPLRLKTLTTAIEDDHPLGRLFDMDVLDQGLRKLDRELVGGGSRDCIVCGAAGRGCASRRVHSIEQLQAAVTEMLCNYFRELDGERVAALAVRSLLDEVCTTPKPGLVDRRNSGAHRDMDLFSFTASAAALAPYFARCVRIGQTQGKACFPALRQAGIQAEQAMFAATGGVNTHKGAIFTLGLLCGAAGCCWTPEGRWESEQLCRCVSELTRETLEGELHSHLRETAGQRAYENLGIRGIRGEVAQGLPSVRELGLPIYQKHRHLGKNQAGVLTLLHLICRVEDTNLLSRGGAEGARAAVEETQKALSHWQEPGVLEALDDWFIHRNLSPGGCADLLAAVYFLDSLGEGDLHE